MSEEVVAKRKKKIMTSQIINQERNVTTHPERSLVLSHPVLILKTVPQDIFIGLGTFYRIMGKLISKTPRRESQEGIEGTTI